ncbi:MAG: primosomal protein N' [Desulfobacteraceae bacterium]|nr:primosomal protein N' [Desulfobacteraceae bacterium]
MVDNESIVKASAAFSGAPFVQVAVTLPVYGTFTYRVPPEFRGQATVGKRVLAPFGRRKITAYVVAEKTEADISKPVKEIVDVLDDHPLFPGSMMRLFCWISDYYLHPLGQVIKTALPAGLTLAEQAVYHCTDAGNKKLTKKLSGNGLMETVLEILAQQPCSFRQLERKINKRLTCVQTKIGDCDPGQVRGVCKNEAVVDSAVSFGQARERRTGPQDAVPGWALTRAVLNKWMDQELIERRTALTGGRLRPKTLRIVIAMPEVSGKSGLSRQRREIIKILTEKGPMTSAALKDYIPTAPRLVSAMAKDGQVSFREQQIYRDPFGQDIVPDKAPSLTQEQEQAVKTMAAALGKGFQTFLLAGVTGSGKTEVYLRLADIALKNGQPALVLIPEIGLISQMERAFRARFGDCVALLHSGLSKGERYDQWLRIANGQARIAIGPRSAVFAPFDQVGLIIVDEEHDDAYKQESALRYHARDMAVVRGSQNNAVVVLGSATPCLQSVYNVQTGKFKCIYLWQRVDKRVLPTVEVEDLNVLKDQGQRQTTFSPALVQAMRQTLERGEQILLFLNRRGYSNLVICSLCGKPIKCSRCDICLTYHQKSNAYKCHYCGLSKAAITRCGYCGSGRVKRLGTGTEKLEQEVQKLFPQARLSRMDRDTTRRRGALVKILKDLRNRNIDILLGTQMVAKGHDYPHITLVGIICADLSLNMPDFRAGERTFQLLAQVAGRSGRGKSPGRVILQTYNPLHFSIVAARRQDGADFYRQELEFRKALQYPPFTRMVQVRFSGTNKDAVAQTAHKAGDFCSRLIKKYSEYADIGLMGPIEAPLSRIAEKYRWQLLVKGPRAGSLHKMMHELIFGKANVLEKSTVEISLDVDPVFLM